MRATIKEIEKLKSLERLAVQAPPARLKNKIIQILQKLFFPKKAVHSASLVNQQAMEYTWQLKWAVGSNQTEILPK